MSKNRITYGTWKVTTDGDCEGRSTRQLGIHEGYLEDIAFALAPQAMYDLTFELADTKCALPLPTRNEVFVKLYSPSGGYSRVKLMEMLNAAGVKNEKGNFYESVRLFSGQTKEEMDHNTALEKLAKAGLTASEKKALGLK